MLQVVSPRDQFENYTLSVEQWLAKEYECGGFGLTSRVDKWQALLRACVLAEPTVLKYDGLREEPRVGYDASGDQFFFLFKASNDGVTCIVSPHGLRFDESELYDASLP